MTGRAKRLTLILMVAALVAFVAGTVIVPDTVAAPKKDKPDKGKPPKDEPPDAGAFAIEVQEEAWCTGYIGSFVATGAIEDTGQAQESWCDGRNVVYLRGARHNMELEMSGDTFEIVYGDGKYGDLVGVTGSHYTPDHEPTNWLYRRFEGTVPE